MGFRHELRTTTSAGCLDLLVGSVCYATCEQTDGTCARYDYPCTQPGTRYAIARPAGIPFSGHT